MKNNQVLQEKGLVAYNELLEISKVRDMLNWEEARRLYELKESGNFKYIFGENGAPANETWQAFIKESEFPLSTVAMKIRLHEFYVVKWKIPVKTLSGIHTRKLDRAITKIEAGKTTIVEVIDVARKLPFLDFKRWLDELK